MEETMMVMMKMKMKIRHPTTTSPTTTQFSPNWKLYENPFYASSRHLPPDAQVHRLHLPVSARKIAASFWDLEFIDHHQMRMSDREARAGIGELKSEAARERAARRKSEAANKRLAKDLSEERRWRQALERACQELVKEVSTGRAEIGRMRREIEEERKMLRTAEIIREERVQMKLADARILLEEKLSELETSTRLAFRPDSTAVARRQNPHIRRGIKGFVEFPRAVRSIGCRNGKRLGNKVECQKAQLKVLLKQRGPVGLNAGLITT